MDLLLDVLMGAGLATACGLDPFVAVFLAGTLAAGDAGLDFEGTTFDFLEGKVFLVLVVGTAAGSFFGPRRPGPAKPLAKATYQGLAMSVGALLFAASLDDHHETWWPGLIAGAGCALLADTVLRDVFGRVRAGFAAKGESRAAAMLPLYSALVALALAGASILAPPVSLLALAFLLVLLVRGRRRAGERYAGLRILR